MAICEKCKNCEKEIQGCLYMDADCVNGSMFEPFTNYDKIKNMSIEEMAEFMRTMLDCVSCQNKMMNNNNPLGKEKCNDTDYFKMCDGDYKKCVAVCKKWLESEVE